MYRSKCIVVHSYTLMGRCKQETESEGESERARERDVYNPFASIFLCGVSVLVVVVVMCYIIAVA